MRYWAHYFLPACFDETTFVETARLELAHPLVPREFDGFSAVALSDLHLSRWVAISYVRRVLDMVRRLRPTVLLVLGDLIAHSGQLSRIIGREFAGLCAEIPTYAVLGNHEYYRGREASVRAWRQAGMNLLINQSCLIGPDGRPASPSEGISGAMPLPVLGERHADGSPRIALVGLDDVIKGRIDPDAALAGVPQEMYTILLTHSPDAADEPGLRGHFMFAGHTHGGQVRLLGAAIRTETKNRRYAAGLVQGPKFPLYITRGLGVNGLPFRLDCPPELVKVTLRSRP